MKLGAIIFSLSFAFAAAAPSLNARAELDAQATGDICTTGAVSIFPVQVKILATRGRLYIQSIM
jgi:hypothetical protein